MPYEIPPTIRRKLTRDTDKSALRQVRDCWTQTSYADAKQLAQECLARAQGLAGVCTQYCWGSGVSVEELKFGLETFYHLLDIAYSMIEDRPDEDEMGVVLDLIKEAFDELEELEGFLNTIRHHRGHPVEDRAVWAYPRRLWAHGDKADQALILRCAKVLDGRPHFRSAVDHLLHKLEERVMPEQHPFFSPSPMAGGDTEKPDA
jgi:hypothetical protein